MTEVASIPWGGPGPGRGGLRGGVEMGLVRRRAAGRTAAPKSRQPGGPYQNSWSSSFDNACAPNIATIPPTVIQPKDANAVNYIKTK